MNSQKGIISVVIAILLALFIGGGVFYAVQQEKEMKNAETADWKTYTNSEVGYSISYPESYHVAFKNDLFNYDETKYEMGKPNGVKIQVQSDTAPLFEVDVELGRQKFIDSLNESIKNDAMKYPPTPIQPISLNQVKYKNSMLKGPGGAFDIYYAFPEDLSHNLQKNSGHYFRILVWGASNDDKNVERILSTFKFTPFTEALTSEEKAILAAREVIKTLTARDYQKFETLVSPDGLSLNQEPNFNPNKNPIAKNDISEIPKDTKVYFWGYTDGRGDPINLTRAEFINYIYSNKVDYLNAPNVAVNKTLTTSGNTPNTIDKDINGRTYVTFNFPGFNPEYAGMDWTSIYLIFDIVNGEYKLRGISKDNWTI